MITIKQSTPIRGFALLITLITISAVLVIMLSLIELSLKQLSLSVDSKDSEITFQATNAGIECAQRVRRIESDDLEEGDETEFECFGEKRDVDSGTSDLSVIDTTKGSVYRYTTDIDWGPSLDQRCTEIDMVVMVSNLTDSVGVGVTGLSDLFAGYNNIKTCPPGGRCTIAVSRGYNAACGDKKDEGVLRREILLEF